MSDLPVGQHVAERFGQSKAFEWRSVDNSDDVKKLLSFAALHLSNCKRQLNTRDEYGSRGFTLKYYTDIMHVSLTRILFIQLKYTY